ncbi:hypothetical protein [Chitinophaga defluvii]|uniref:Uncharacterized protein n=1 Tax=Chitinophaga defluvii TaxID=3163343 RepID=A0ABV2T7Y3_9BACT
MKVMFCCTALLLMLFACREQPTHKQKAIMQVDTMQFSASEDSIIAVHPTEIDTTIQDSLATTQK